uniref:G-protein coupled receptors family 1 profile domain-containing protein n=1 Tax=Nannospalax galili TaxID=1026970 RepID=A0A8C6W1A9_NANGA
FLQLSGTYIDFLVIFLTLYLLTLTGNVIIVTIISIDCHVHTPRYFFLGMLSSSETVYTVVIVPRILSSLRGSNQPISLAGCAIQMSVYTVIMNKGLCAQLVWGSCSIGLLVATNQIASAFRMTFCDREETHYFCDICLVMKLSCADTTVHDIVNFIISLLVIVVPMSLVCGCDPLWLCLHCLPQAQIREHQGSGPADLHDLYCIHPSLTLCLYLRNKGVKDAIYHAIGK